MSMSKEVKGMVTGMAGNAEDLSVNEDSEKDPKVTKLETLQVVEVERLKLKEEVSWTLKSVEVELRLAEVLEWLVADPQVLNHCLKEVVKATDTFNVSSFNRRG